MVPKEPFLIVDPYLTFFEKSAKYKGKGDRGRQLEVIKLCQQLERTIIRPICILWVTERGKERKDKTFCRLKSGSSQMLFFLRQK
jgi:hypothetical protein